jgi:hypothetical protein
VVKRLLPLDEVQLRLGDISKTTLDEKFVKTKRLRLVSITERRVGVVEAELDELIDELAAVKK